MTKHQQCSHISSAAANIHFQQVWMTVILQSNCPWKCSVSEAQVWLISMSTLHTYIIDVLSDIQPEFFVECILSYFCHTCKNHVSKHESVLVWRIYCLLGKSYCWSFLSGTESEAFQTTAAFSCMHSLKFEWTWPVSVMKAMTSEKSNFGFQSISDFAWLVLILTRFCL